MDISLLAFGDEGLGCFLDRDSGLLSAVGRLGLGGWFTIPIVRVIPYGGNRLCCRPFPFARALSATLSIDAGGCDYRATAALPVLFTLLEFAAHRVFWMTGFAVASMAREGSWPNFKPR